MIVVIIPSDSLVIVDGEPQTVDCSTVITDPRVYHIQWDTVRLFGTIEFTNDPQDPDNFRGNQNFTSFTTYQPLLDAWQVKHNAMPIPPDPHMVQRSVAIGQSFKSSLYRKALKAEKDGDTFGAVKLLIKAK